MLTTLAEVRDGRRWGRYPLAELLRVIVAGQWHGFHSFNRIAQLLRERHPAFAFLRGERRPSAEMLGDTLAALPELDDLRRLLRQVAYRVKRNKALLPTVDLVCAIDGHELFASFSRHCPHCLQRRITCRDPKTRTTYKRTQYYHRVVVAAIVTDTLILPLDLELQRPGESEVTAAHRLMRRLFRWYPRFFHWVTLDAIYAGQPTLELIHRQHKRFVVTLKENCPELLAEARRLRALSPGEIVSLANGRQTLTDVPALTLWPVSFPLRAVNSREETWSHPVRQGEARAVVAVADWWWITNEETERAPTAWVARIGHGRWKIENRGFNELVNQWQFDHCYHHHPQAIVAMGLLTLLAYETLDLMYHLNLKPTVRNRCSKAAFREQLAVEDCRETVPRAAAAAPG